MEFEDKSLNEIKFIPIFKQDETSAYYEMHYLGFPNFIGYGKTEEEAELNLLEILLTALMERKEKIRESCINEYFTDSK
jgi:predicted RNase H-like HicB family nuclease